MTMQKIGFGQKASFEQNTEILSLKSKGEKVTLRFLDSPHYDAKHFIKKTPLDWEVTECSRIMTEEYCEYCDLFFKASKELKKLKEEKSKDEERKKILENDKRTYKPSISFYYPVINRDTEEFVIFKTSLMVRIAIDKEFNNGINVVDFDYVVERTEKTGSYYEVTRLPEKSMKKFTEKENEAVEKFNNLDEEGLQNMIGKKSKTSSDSWDEEVPTPEDPEV